MAKGYPKGLARATLPASTAATRGGAKKMVYQAPAAAADVAALKTQFDALLGKMVTAGLMAGS
jgi:hypothetical protein